MAAAATADGAGFYYTRRHLDELDFHSEIDPDRSVIYRELLREKRTIDGTCFFKTATMERAQGVEEFPLSTDGNLVDHAISLEHLDLTSPERDMILTVKPLG